MQLVEKNKYGADNERVLALIDIGDLIKFSPYNNNVKNNLLRILPDLNQMKNFNAKQSAYARLKLNSLAEEACGDRASLICHVIKILKTLDFHIVGKDRDEVDRHVVSDHALCAALRRYLGFDVQKLKDQILATSKHHNWIAVRRNGKIVTFYPPIPTEAA